MIRWLRRRRALRELDRIDAEVAHWYVDDGQLSERPLNGRLSPHGWALRSRRLKAVERLSRVGGRDPAPALLREPTAAQKAGQRPAAAPRIGPKKTW